MISAQPGSIRLLRVAGIQVYLHWSWLLIAVYQVTRPHSYDSDGWKVAEYLALFGIVLLHEFGHAFASRQVGGESQEILLWPFGGIAFARVPPRPGAELWAVAAGPLVNVVLYPVLWGLLVYAQSAGWGREYPDLIRFLVMTWWMNNVLLVFNILPVYPLDGGQILRALLWFAIGRARSLKSAAIVGFLGLPFLAWLGVKFGQPIISLLMVFLLGQGCLAGYRQAKALGA